MYDGSLATIQNSKNKRYIAMDSNGTVYSTVSKNATHVHYFAEVRSDPSSNQ